MPCQVYQAVAKYRVIHTNYDFFGIGVALDLFVIRIILVGPIYSQQTLPMQLAIQLHEEAHFVLNHVVKRWWWAITGLWWRNPEKLKKCLHEQEFEADAYCAARGLSGPLMQLLLKYPSRGNRVHPNSEDRIARLRAYDEKQRRIPPWRAHARN